MLKWVYLAGPVLFLIAQLLSPGGSPDAEQRLSLIRANADASAIGLQVAIVSFALLLFTLVGFAGRARAGGQIVTDLGLILTGAGVLANMGIAVIQLIIVQFVRDASLPTLLLIRTIDNSIDIAGFVYVPYALIVPGLLLMAVAIWRAERDWILPGLVVASGLLIVAGGLAHNKWLLVIGAALLLAGALVALLRPPASRVA